MAAQHQIDGRVAQPQISQRHLIEELWKPRVTQQDLVLVRIEFEPKRSLEEQQRSACRPGLWRTRDRIKRGSALTAALEAAIELRQAPQIHVACGIEQALKHTVDRVLVPIARKPCRDERVVVRPNRPVVIGHRVVAALLARHGTNAPSGKEGRPHQVAHHGCGALRCGDAAEQHVTGIRSPNAARLLLAVEGERVGSDVIAPERGFELEREPGRLGIQRVASRVLAKPACGARHQALCREDIALHLAKGDGAARKRTVGVENRVLGILPALIDQTHVVGALIFDEAVTVGVTRPVDPAQRRFDIGPQFVQGFDVAGVLGIEPRQHDEQRCRIHAAIIEAERNLVQRGHLTVAHFVENFPGLGVGAGIELLRLVSG